MRKIERLDRLYTRELKRETPDWEKVSALRRALVAAILEKAREKEDGGRK